MSTIIHNLIQNSHEWHQFRAEHWPASEAPVMMGLSPYRSRADLLRARASGIAEDVSADTQRLFDRGHRAEALARPLAEQIIGDELFPATVSNGKLSASLDGMTMDGSVIFEHKLMSQRLREAFAAIEEQCGDGALLPEDHRIQMEQQLAASGAERCLFMASEWDADGNLIAEFHTWYEPDLQLRARIVAGWEQFAADLAAYKPDAEPVTQVAPVHVTGFGALSLRVEGRVLASNLDAFRADADAFLARLPKPDDLQDDQDFAEAEGAVKACAEAETRIKEAKGAALAQMADVDAVLRAADSVAETIRQARLALEKVVKAEKENRKAEIVSAGAAAVRAHYDSINATMGEHRFFPPQSLQMNLGAAIKGLRSLQSMRDAVDAAVAQAKIDASQHAEKVRANVAILAEHQQHAGLFPDRVTLCDTKRPDDLRNLVAARVREHEAKEQARLDAERDRIRREEQERIEREHRAANPLPSNPSNIEPKAHRESETAVQARAGDVPGTLAAVAQPAEQAPCKGTVAGSIPAGGSTRKVKLGEICAAIAPLSLTADGLSQLGFEPVGHERAAKLYRAADFPLIVSALVERLNAATLEAAA